MRVVSSLTLLRVSSLIPPGDYLWSYDQYSQTTVLLIFIFRCICLLTAFLHLASRPRSTISKPRCALSPLGWALYTSFQQHHSTKGLNQLTGYGQVYWWEASDRCWMGFVRTSLTAFRSPLLRFISTRQWSAVLLRTDPPWISQTPTFVLRWNKEVHTHCWVVELCRLS